MRLRRVLFGALIAGVGVGFLTAGPAAAQSVSIGNGLIDVLDAQDDDVFNVDSTGVDLGSAGADVDLFIRSSAAGAQALWFNTSVGGLYIGGTANGGEMWLRDTASQVTLQTNSAGDLILGAGTADGDITVREATTNRTNFSVDGNTATVTVGAQGGTGDGGILYLRDQAGVINNVQLRGADGEAFLGSTTTGDDGDISLSNGTSSNFALDLEGSNGTITNIITGNGIVKAWARMNSNGTVASCYRCSTSAANTNRISLGNYEVDFTIDANIDSRPVVCSSGHNAVSGTSGAGISCVGRTLDDSSVFVSTFSPAGTSVDSYFTIVVF